MIYFPHPVTKPATKLAVATTVSGQKRVGDYLHHQGQSVTGKCVPLALDVGQGASKPSHRKADDHARTLTLLADGTTVASRTYEAGADANALAQFHFAGGSITPSLGQCWIRLKVGSNAATCCGLENRHEESQPACNSIQTPTTGRPGGMRAGTGQPVTAGETAQFQFAGGDVVMSEPVSSMQDIRHLEQVKDSGCPIAGSNPAACNSLYGQRHGLLGLLQPRHSPGDYISMPRLFSVTETK